MILADKFYWTTVLDAKLRSLYGTMLIADVAKSLNTTTHSIRYRASKLGLKRNKRKYTFDDHRFCQQDNAAFYWAGFIAADGSLQDNDTSLRIMLSSIDHQHLLKFQKFMCSDNPVKISNRHESYIVFHGAYQSTQFLASLNITSRKSLTLQPPTLINEDHIRAFIRGMIDGDGCISYRKDHKSWSVSFVGTKDVTTWVSKQLSRFVPVSCNTPSQAVGMFIVGWEGPQTKYIIEWLYQDSLPETRLDRKYQLAQRLLQDYQDKKPFRAASKYRGVSFYKREQKWVAAIKITGNKQVIGYFNTEYDAALAYNNKARELGLLERCYAVS